MSSIDPSQIAIIKELQSRREQLSPDKRAIVDELSSRLGTTNDAAPARTWLDSATDFAKGYGSMMNPLPALQALYNGGHPLDGAWNLVKGAGQAQVDQFQKAKAAFDNGNYSEAVGHTIAGVTPLVGPAAANAGEDIGKGDIAKGLGEASALLTPAAISGLKAGLAPRATAAAQDMYGRALNVLPKKTPAAAVGALARTGLDYGVKVNPEGLTKLGGLLDDVNGAIADKISAGAGQGVTVDPSAVATRVDQAKAAFQNQVNPEADLKALDASRREFLRTHPNPIPADEAQAIKQGTYRQLHDKSYGELSSAAIEAQKSLARGIKEELASQIPELSGLNAEDSRLIQLNKAVESAVNRQLNSSRSSLKDAASVLMVKGLGGGNKLAAGVAAVRAVLADPGVKSSLAMILDSAAERAANPSWRPSGSRIATLMGALGQTISPSPSGPTP